jgi:hypothetical protein
MLGTPPFYEKNIYWPGDCMPDWNGDEALNSQDVIAFLNSFVVGEADYNGDCTTNSQDFIEFLNDFTNPPPGC